MEAGPRNNGETPAEDIRDPAEVWSPEEAPPGSGTSSSELLDGFAGPGPQRTPGAATPEDSPEDVPDGSEEADPTRDAAEAEPAEEPQELRPQRKLRLWQLTPIVALATLGSLMFAFPLAFEPSGSSGAMVAMLGLLFCGSALGWGVVAARRVGHTWPGLPARGSAERPDWRVVLLYAVLLGTLVTLAIWRVTRLS